MHITEVKPLRRQLYQIVGEDGETAQIDRRTFDESGFAEGSTLSEQAWESLLEESRRRRARETALYLLSVKERSRAELQEKLRQEAGAELAEETARQMEALGLVDDTSYAERLAEDLRRIRHFSCRRTEQELRHKGIDREVAAAAAAAVDTTDEEQALALLRKKRYNKECDEKIRRRMADLLARHGYDYETVRRALEQAEKAEE